MPLTQGGECGAGGADCYSQCAHWLRNDSFLQGVRCEPGRATARVAPTGVGWGSAYETGRCGAQIQRRRWRKKQNERVAAFKITSVRRGAAQNFWAPQQGYRPLRKHNKRCGAGGADCHSQCTHWLRNDSFLQGVRCKTRRADIGIGPFGSMARGTVQEDADCHSQCAHWLRNDSFLQGVRCKTRRADIGIGPFGSMARGARGAGERKKTKGHRLLPAPLLCGRMGQLHSLACLFCSWFWVLFWF